MPAGRLRMDSLTGKRLLSLVRDGDYAHPGEEEAVDRLVAGLPPDPSRSILDAGCGRGGTADYVRRLGLGSVTGLDRDPQVIAEARRLYPRVRFVIGAIEETPQVLGTASFDLVYLMTVLHALADQAAALGALRRVVRRGARLRLLEYADPHGMFMGRRSSAGGPVWRPLRPDALPDLLSSAGWRCTSVRDLSSSFERWYEDLCRRIAEREGRILAETGRDWFELLADEYGELLRLVREGRLGGVMAFAEAV